MPPESDSRPSRRPPEAARAWRSCGSVPWIRNTAARAAHTVRVSAALLRRAAKAADAGTLRETLTAARTLRDAVELLAWQVRQWEHGSGRQRTAAAALAEFSVTANEFQHRYQAAERQGRELKRNQRLMDRLAREAIHARESERARIAHQIHDTAAGSMVSAFRFLNAATAAVESGAVGDWRTYTTTATDRVQTAIDEMRSVLGGLIPLGLELGLQHAIRYRHEALVGEAKLRGTVTGSVPRLHAAVEQGLFGMVAEAMTNCVRHARATTLNVEMKVVRGHVLIVIQDDGIGFDAARPPRRIKPDRGLGLPGLYLQARWFGGSTRIISRPGRGTKVRISIPFERHRVATGPTSSDATFAASGVAR